MKLGTRFATLAEGFGHDGARRTEDQGHERNRLAKAPRLRSKRRVSDGPFLDAGEELAPAGGHRDIRTVSYTHLTLPTTPYV